MRANISSKFSRNGGKVFAIFIVGSFWRWRCGVVAAWRRGGGIENVVKMGALKQTLLTLSENVSLEYLITTAFRFFYKTYIFVFVRNVNPTDIIVVFCFFKKNIRYVRQFCAF